MSLIIDRKTYITMFGPTTGDRVRLADTDLIIEVEKDYAVYGDETRYGPGKVLRDGLGQAPDATREKGALDLVITNALIVDASGIVKADIGIRDGKIVGIGKAGNPNIMDGVSPTMVVGASTEALAGMGLKLHEDWGTTPAAIDCCLKVADEYDVQVTIHTDTLNETGFVEDTIAAIGGRTIHAYHVEGAGGGHAPDIIKIVSYPHVLTSSTNPTMPYTVNTLEEHLDMLMVCHHLDPRIPEDIAQAEARIRAETIAAEDILPDMGAVSMMGSDSQAMGRVGETIIRTWQTADKMKRQRGRVPEERGDNDNVRVKRYIAKYTVNRSEEHTSELQSLAYL